MFSISEFLKKWDAKLESWEQKTKGPEVLVVEHWNGPEPTLKHLAVSISSGICIALVIILLVA